ncbi:putative ABC transporter [Candidatus Magnetomoraceae bacterium gMMP-1]
MIQNNNNTCGNMCIAGLRVDPNLFDELQKKAVRLNSVINFKEKYPDIDIIFAFMGGTGTGKSSLFNALIGSPVSSTGVERPLTGGGILYAHKDVLTENKISDFPWPEKKSVVSLEQLHQPLKGSLKSLFIVLHPDAECRVIITDCPDIDSIVEKNESIALDLYLMADHIIFTSTPEKYADDQPASLLKQAVRDGKDISFVLNKVAQFIDPLEIKTQLHKWNLPEKVKFFSIGFFKLTELNDFLNEITPFKKWILNKTDREKRAIKQREIASAKKNLSKLKREIDEMTALEAGAVEELSEFLGIAFLKAKNDLDHAINEYSDGSLKEHIKPHLQKIYQKHDLLAPVRNIISSVIKFPLSLLGLNKQDIKNTEKYPKIDPAPLFLSLTDYQFYVSRNVKHKLFMRGLQEKKPEMSRSEANLLLDKGTQEVHKWLEEKFIILKKGIPVHKKAGIHGLSMAWGAIIISLETISGGGLSILDIAIDSILAPYVTSGTIELFVVNELKMIVKKLQKRYTAILHSILSIQHQRYIDILEDLKPKTILRSGLVMMEKNHGK